MHPRFGTGSSWRRRPLAVAVAPLALTAALTTTPAADGRALPRDLVCAPPQALVNGGFEEPRIKDADWSILDQSRVPGWATTASDRRIELWAGGLNGIPAAEGRQFAELNANEPASLYQDIATTPGSRLRWRLSHRGRKGVDTMDVLIGPPGGPLRNQGELSDGNTAWGTHTGSYVVPYGQRRTRFAFRAVRTAGGGLSTGNFLDGITFGSPPCLAVDKKVTNLSGHTWAEPGDILRYTVTVRGDGGDRADGVVLDDPLPAVVGYVAGSLAVEGPGASGPLTDAEDDDTGALLDGGRLRVHLGEGATRAAGGTLMPGARATVSFRVRVLPAGRGTLTRNTVTVGYTDRITATRHTSHSTVYTAIGSAADLAVTGTVRPSGPLAPSARAAYAFTVTNKGPAAATHPVVTVALPPGLAGVRVATADGTPCAVEGGRARCPLGTLGVGESARLTVTGTVRPGTPPGTELAVTAAVRADQPDPEPGNDTATVRVTVTARPTPTTPGPTPTRPPRPTTSPTSRPTPSAPSTSTRPGGPGGTGGSGSLAESGTGTLPLALLGAVPVGALLLLLARRRRPRRP
ncbi:DUF11 domain-containing protein [Streptomyces sp. NPDC048659]|uniref:DUF11 domain-containing protein n=1 Tax=Streptomyces sp. NPDC048659 TaxID=3155489 RepID=UPI00343DB0CB